MGKAFGAEEISIGICKVFYKGVFLVYFSENDIRVKPAYRKGRQKSIKLDPR